MNDPDVYPLSWPATWSRTQRPQRSRFDVSSARARNGLLYELRLLGARDVVISSNAKLLRTGEIAARQGRIDDMGIAVYFNLEGERRCIPVDKWDRIEDNLHAAELTVAALRGLSRWGTPGIVAAAFQGFAALPEGEGAAWWRVLGVEPTASEVEIESAYRRLARRHHPDVPTGNREQFERIAEAYRQAKTAQGKATA